MIELKKGSRLAVSRTTVAVLLVLLVIGLGVGVGSLYTIDSISSGGNTTAPKLPPVSTTSTTTVQNLPFSVSCTPDPVAIGSTSFCSATLNSYSNSASGSVTWKSGSLGTFVSKNSCTLILGACSVNYSSGAAGQSVITATFSGNKYNPSTSTTFNLYVNKASSATVLSCTGVSSIGQQSKCDAIVSGYGTPRGNVSFVTSGSGQFSSNLCTLVAASCFVYFTPTSVSTLSQNITATYGGDTDNNMSSGSFPMVVGAKTSVTAINCATISIPIGSNVVCTVTVSGFTPTGNVTWSSTDAKAKFTPSAACLLNSGSCKVTYTPSSIGSSTVTALYLGDANNSGSSGSIVINTNPVSTTVSVNCSPGVVSVHSPTTCTATVHGQAPTGVVSWSSSSLGTFSATSCTLTAQSCSVVYTPTTLVSPVTLTGTYQGDANNNAGTGTFQLTVALVTSSLSLSCSPSPIAIDSSSNCSASVTGFSPTGSISFTSTDLGASFSPSSCNVALGPCLVTYTPSAVGQATITGTYSGDANNGPATNTFPITVTAVTSTTRVECPPVTIGGTTSCTITVTGYGTPSGTVSFTSTDTGATFSPSPCTLSSGSCVVTYTPSVAGGATINASYSGDSVNAPSFHLRIVNVNQVTPNIVVSCNPTTVPSGTSTSCTVTVTGYNPTGTITWQTSGLGTFSVNTCQLSSGQCNVQYTATNDAPGSFVTISASYSGDINNAAGDSSTDGQSAQLSIV